MSGEKQTSPPPSEESGAEPSGRLTPEEMAAAASSFSDETSSGDTSPDTELPSESLVGSIPPPEPSAVPETESLPDMERDIAWLDSELTVIENSTDSLDPVKESKVKQMYVQADEFFDRLVGFQGLEVSDKTRVDGDIKNVAGILQRADILIVGHHLPPREQLVIDADNLPENSVVDDLQQMFDRITLAISGNDSDIGDLEETLLKISMHGIDPISAFEQIMANAKEVEGDLLAKINELNERIRIAEYRLFVNEMRERISRAKDARDAAKTAKQRHVETGAAMILLNPAQSGEQAPLAAINLKIKEYEQAVPVPRRRKVYRSKPVQWVKNAVKFWYSPERWVARNAFGIAGGAVRLARLDRAAAAINNHTPLHRLTDAVRSASTRVVEVVNPPQEVMERELQELRSLREEMIALAKPEHVTRHRLWQLTKLALLGVPRVTGAIMAWDMSNDEEPYKGPRAEIPYYAVLPSEELEAGAYSGLIPTVAPVINAEMSSELPAGVTIMDTSAGSKLIVVDGIRVRSFYPEQYVLNEITRDGRFFVNITFTVRANNFKIPGLGILNSGDQVRFRYSIYGDEASLMSSKILP